MGRSAVWIALSTIWSVSPSGSAREVERMLVYVSVAHRRRHRPSPRRRAGRRGREHSSASTAIAAYGLATRLFPDRFETSTDMFNAYRLAEPLGYWNAFGLAAAMAIVLAVGFVAHARRARSAVRRRRRTARARGRALLHLLSWLLACADRAASPGRSSSTRVASRCSGRSSSSPRPRRSASRSRRLERR